jgi:hypothetical protein
MGFDMAVADEAGAESALPRPGAPQGKGDTR